MHLNIMQTKNIYHLPIELKRVTKIEHESVGHVGDMKYAIDYDAPEGTAVFAALEGKVISVCDNSKIGGDERRFEEDANYIEILHENDEISEYEHLQFGSAKVKIGDTVRGGDIIAAVGNTGWSECPHLHFMVYPKFQPYKTIEIKFSRYAH